MLFLNSALVNGMLLQLKENIYCLNCPNCVLSTVKQQPIISLPCDGSKLTGLCLSLNNQHIHVRVLSIILANSQRKKHRGVFCKWKIIAALRDSGVAADLKRGLRKARLCQDQDHCLPVFSCLHHLALFKTPRMSRFVTWAAPVATLPTPK